MNTNPYRPCAPGQPGPRSAAGRLDARRILTSLALAGATLALTSWTTPARAGDSETVCEAYWEQRYDEAITLAQEILRSKADPSSKVQAYRCKACTHVARKEVEPAKETIVEMLELDDSARFSPDSSYPPPVIDLYHVIRDSLFAGTMDINTVAVGDFEDNSIYQGKFKDYDFSLFQGALIHTINADLSEATDLKLVDRQRIEKITAELDLNRSGFVDPEHAVRAGQLLGAQSYIFGQYMILSKDKVRIDARVVHTATGEIVLTKQVTGEFAGDPMKFLDLEKELVVALAQGIDKIRKMDADESNLEEEAEAFSPGSGAR